MRRVEAGDRCALAPDRALELWTDTRRWPSFVEGFAAVERDDGWPAPGSTLVWISSPSGRGRVTEQVLEHDPAGRLVLRVFEEALNGTQTVAFRRAEEGPAAGQTVVELALEYELPETTLGRRIADRLFIRRALRDAQARTLRRFCVEADEDALEAAAI